MNISNTVHHINVQGVNLMIGYEIDPIKDLQVRLGKLNVQLIDSKDEVHTVYPSVVVDIADLRKVLSHPDTRAEWERELRYTVGNDEQFLPLFESVDNVTDIFVKRVLATQRMRNAGWRTASATLDLNMILK